VRRHYRRHRGGGPALTSPWEGVGPPIFLRLAQGWFGESGSGRVKLEAIHPLVEQLTHRLAEMEVDGFPDLSDLFDEIAEIYVPWRLNALLRQVSEDPDAAMRIGARQFLLLASDDRFSLGLSIVDRRPRYLNWHASHIWYRGMGGSIATVRRYLLPQGTANEVVDPDIQLELAETRTFGPGEVMVRDGRSDIIDFELQPNRPIVVLRLQLALFGGLEWMFDRSTLRPVGANSLNPTHSHLTSLAYAASLVGDSSSIEPLELALSHPNHAVRWAAVQAIGRLDRNAALRALGKLSDDPHPHVRRSAARMLERAGQVGGAAAGA